MLTDPEHITYGQRIALGKLLQGVSGMEEVQVFKDVLGIMNGGERVTHASITPRNVRYVQRVIDKLTYWVNAEQTMLQVEPEPDEIKAGIKTLGEKLQELSVLHTLAEKFGKSPDEILEWEFSTVFGMLYADKEKNLYYKRLQKIKDKKK